MKVDYKVSSAGKLWVFTQAKMCRLAASYWPPGDDGVGLPFWQFRRMAISETLGNGIGRVLDL